MSEGDKLITVEECFVKLVITQFSAFQDFSFVIICKSAKLQIC